MATIKQAFKKRIWECAEKYKPTYQISYMENKDIMETEFTVNAASTAQNELQDFWNDFCKDNGLKKNYATIDFTVDEEEQQDELNRTIRLPKWNEDKKNGWEIRVDTTPNLYSLRNMEEFDLLLIKLQRADVRLVADELGDEDYVYSDTKPEPTYE